MSVSKTENQNWKFKITYYSIFESVGSLFAVYHNDYSCYPFRASRRALFSLRAFAACVALVRAGSGSRLLALERWFQVDWNTCNVLYFIFLHLLLVASSVCSFSESHENKFVWFFSFVDVSHRHEKPTFIRYAVCRSWQSLCWFRK